MKKDHNPYLQTELKYFLHTFKRQPLLLTKAKDSRVWDEKGKMYFDFFSGLAVCGVGHNNRRVVAAVKRQAERLIHSSNYFYTRPQTDLAKALTARWANSRVFFANSGAEANELAIKLARLWAYKKGKPGRTIVTFENAFHGRTLATTAASRSRARPYDEFAPFPEGFISVPYNDLASAQSAVTKDTIAIMLEPIQGEGGIRVADETFLSGLGELCRNNDLLLILDEIQSGMGRTGTFFAFEHYGVQPDIVTLAKGLAGGLPLAATLAQPRVAEHVIPGLHGSTFGGNPVACAASLEVLKLLTPRALQQIQKTARTLKEKLSSFSRYRAVRSVRALGLMSALELHENGDRYVALAREKGLLINCTQGNVLRFLPPYFINKKDLDSCLSILTSVFDEIERNSPPSA